MSARKGRRKGRSSERLRRGVYLLPSLFTVGNIFCGFFSMVQSVRGELGTAAVLILVAVVADVLDGRIARLTNTTSPFGEALDSLADVISFGAAPALLAFTWGLWQKPRLGFAVAFLFLVAGAIRLARFNAAAHDDPIFRGLPIPGGASAIALLVLVSPEPVTHTAFLPVVVVFVLATALLMVSNLPYPSFKNVDLRKRWPTTTFFLIAVVFSLLTFAPTHVLSILLAVYVLSAPAKVLGGKIRHRAGVPPVEAEGPQATEAHHDTQPSQDGPDRPADPEGPGVPQAPGEHARSDG